MKKILRLSTGFGPIESQTALLCKPADDIESYYLFDGYPDPVDINFDKYECIWVYTDERFPDQFPRTYEKLLESKVRKVNMGVARINNQFDMTNSWREAGFPVPEIYRMYLKGTLPESIDKPVMAKAIRSYTRNSYARVVRSMEDMEKWNFYKRYDYMLQEYKEDYAKPTEDNLYYCGQVYKTGNRIFERSLRWTNHWYVSPTNRGLPHLGLRCGSGAFDVMPGYKDIPDFWDQVAKIYESAGIEIGTLDFSITENKEIVPWGVCTLYLFYCEGIDGRQAGLSIPTPQEQIPIQVEYWNGIMEYIGSAYRTNETLVWRAINAHNLNL
mgnify:CR=1 FL=1